MMKRFIFILIVGVCVLDFFPMQAQTNAIFQSDFSIGVGGGITLNKVDFVPRILQTYKKGFWGGISFRYISENHLGLQAEINLSNRGWKEDWTQTDSTYLFSRSLNYLEIPVLTHIYFGKNSRFFVNIGPQFSYFLGDQKNMNAPLSTYIKKQKQAFPDNPNIAAQYNEVQKKLEYGLAGGMGMEFRSGIGYFDLEGRYYFGLSDIFNNRKADAFSRSAHRMIEAKVTYFFPIFK